MKQTTYQMGWIIGIYMGLLLPASSAENSTNSNPAPIGPFSAIDYGAKPDSTTDNTAAIQKAVDEAAKLGGTVYLPPGRYRVDGSIKVRRGVSILGENQAPQSWEPLKGTIILATGGRDNEEAPALFDLRASSSVKGLTVYYPDQSVDEIHPYPWTFRIGGDKQTEEDITFDCTIENITLINSYNGIKTGPAENGRHRIMSVHGCVLRRGIFIDWTGDIGRLENVQFHCHFWAHKETKGDFKKIFKYMQDNLEAFIFGRTDWEYVTNTFVFPAKIGYKFIKTPNGRCNGQFSGIGADATQNCLYAEEIQHMGLLITNGEFNSHQAGESTQIIVAKACRGSIRFTNCAFWGPVNHNAVIKGDSTVSFLNCYFSNNNKTDKYAIVAENGKLQVIGCTFNALESEQINDSWYFKGEKAQPPSIHLMPQVKHAVITGNNGFNGVKIKNEIGEKAMIRDNENSPEMQPDQDSGRKEP